MADDAPNDRVFVTFLVLAFIFLVSLGFALFPRHEPSAPVHASSSQASASPRADA
jgi:hypothetical protein